MTFKCFKTIDVGSVAAGATFSGEWISDADYLIKRVYFVDKTGTPLYNVPITARIAEDVWTKDIAPAIIFGPDKLLAPEIDKPITKGEKFEFSGENLTGAAIDLFVVLELWEKE